MADVIPFPCRSTEAEPQHFREARVIGEETGICVRILFRISRPHDLLVVLDGTFEGTSTVASTPAEKMDVAEVIGHAVLAALEAAEITWSLRKQA